MILLEQEGKFHIKVRYAWNPPFFQISIKFGAYVHTVWISKSTKFQTSISNRFSDITIKSWTTIPLLEISGGSAVLFIF